MASDPCKLKPSELCRLLNSTPLGEVITTAQLKRHRTRAGLRIGDGQTVDLVRYVAWLRQQRQQGGKMPETSTTELGVIAQAATGAAENASRSAQIRGHGEKLSLKQEALIAALLTAPSYAAAAEAVGIWPSTLYRWMEIDSFKQAYRQARRELVEMAMGRMQAASGVAVDALVHIARHGRKESDRVRASVALLDRALLGLREAELLHGTPEQADASPLQSQDVVKLLSHRLRELDLAEIGTAEKTRLTVQLAESLLRAIRIEVLDERLQALAAILLERKDQ